MNVAAHPRYGKLRKCAELRHPLHWTDSMHPATSFLATSFGTLVLALLLTGIGPPSALAQTASTLVRNTGQTAGPHVTALNANQHGLYQGFRTGWNAADFELTGISLYVGDTRDRRHVSVDAGLYRGDRDDLSHAHLTRVATLTRSSFDEHAHNEWEAPARTFLLPDTNYYIVLTCSSGCANDNRIQFGMTRSAGEDAGAEGGWSIHDRLGFRRDGATKWKLDADQALRIRVKGRPSPARAYLAEIISTPANGHTYLQGENIDIVLRFNTRVSVGFHESVIGIRVGDATDGTNYRAARVVAGSGNRRLLYRYQVRMDDADATGISVDDGGPGTGFGGPLPTVVDSFGTVQVIRHYPGLPDDDAHRVDGSFQVAGVAITSTPEHDVGYLFGDEIEVTLTFSADAHVPSDGSSIGIRVGDDVDSSRRTARYVSGSGSRTLEYRYRVQLHDVDATGITVEAGGPDSGFGGPLPTTSAKLGSRPVSRHYAGLADHPDHRVARSVAASFSADAFTAAEGGAEARIAVRLDADPDREVVIPIIANPANGAATDDYTLSAARLTFARGETEQHFTVAATDDADDDDGETVTLLFGDLPAGVVAGREATATVTIADDDGAAAGQSVTIDAGRETYTVELDDVTFALTLVEAAPQPVEVHVRLTQEQPFLHASDLEQRVTFAAGATRATLRVPADRLRPDVTVDGALTATVIAGAGYRIGTPATASVRMVAVEPALITRLERSRYRFDEGAAAPAAIRVIMETLPGVPPPNRSHEVTVASAPGTADSDQDYAAFSRELTFSPEAFAVDGDRWIARKTVDVPLLDDETDEPEEQFSVTLARDTSHGSRIQARNPDRSKCDGACEAEIVIVDDDDLGVSFLDADGNPITDLRLAVPEGEQVTYRLKLDRRPAHWVIIVREPGEGDPDLFPVSERSWVYSPDEPATAPGVHHWEEPFPVTVEALHDDDDTHGERRFRHYLLSDDQGRTELPELVLVEVDDEAEDTPAGVTLWSADLTVASDGEGLLGYFGDGGLAPDRWVEDGTAHTVEHLTWSAERSEIELFISTAPPAADELTLHVGETALPFADADGETTFIWTERELDWEEGREVAVRLVRTSGGAGLAVADADAHEGDGAVLEFRVSLDRAASVPVSVDYATADGTATAGEDYTAASGTLHFETGETEHTVTVAVLDDAHDEAEETMTLTLSNAQGAHIEDGEATGTITNTDPLPQAWLARFGRTAAGQVMDAVEGRLNGPPAASQAIVAGRLLGPTPAAARAGRDLTAGEFHAIEPAALLAGSSFDLVSGSSETGGEDGGRWTAWGRGAWSRFAGADGGLDLDGEVVTGTVGADYEHGAVLGGLALAYSSGSGTFSHASGRSGELQSSVAGVYPYLRLALHERVSAWGMFGYGLFGDLTLAYRDAEPIKTDLGLMMGAFGVDGTLLSAEHSGGLELAAKADGLLVRTTSQAAPGLAAAEANVSRWRVLLEASHRGLPLLGGYLAPAVETGGRYDDGDAERGAGLVVGGRLSYTLPSWGLTLQAGGAGLLAHESEGFREWTVGGSLSIDPGAPGRGLAVRVAPSWGEASTGVAGLWSMPAAAGAGATTASAPGAQVEAELSYGLDGPGGHGVATPYAGISQSEDGDRTWRLGARYGTPSATLNVEVSRRERADATAAHPVEVSGSVHY